MAITIGAILALLSIAVAVYPFVRHRLGFANAANNPATDKAADAADGELEAVYAAIRTLQLERELGNIPEGLYREQLDGYRLQAALILRERQQSLDAETSLEEEIRLARATLRPAAPPDPKPKPEPEHGPSQQQDDNRV